MSIDKFLADLNILETFPIEDYENIHYYLEPVTENSINPYPIYAQLERVIEKLDVNQKQISEYQEIIKQQQEQIGQLVRMNEMLLKTNEIYYEKFKEIKN